MKLTYLTGLTLLTKNICKGITRKAAGLCALAAVAGLSACDPLGIEPTSEVFEDQFWTNQQLARSYVNQFYTWAPATANDAFTAEQWSDNAVGNDETDWTTYRQTSFTHRQYDALTSIDGFSAPWGGQYKNIRAVNLGIKRLPDVPDQSEATTNQLLAECYFFRAWLYFELEQYWGAVPYIDEVMTVFDETMLPQMGREELFDKILADCDKSIELFTASGVKPQIGLVNVDAVRVIKSRIALYAACAADASKSGLYERLNGEEKTKALFRFTKPASDYYTIAYNAVKPVIGKYTLDEDYAHLFNSYEGHKESEAIWPVMFNKDNRSGFNPAGKHAPVGKYYGSSTDFDKSWDVRGSAYPTQDLVDCYYQKDEADGEWKQWWKTKQARDMGVTVDGDVIRGVSADYGKMYENRDKRFYSTILYDGAYYAGKEKEMYLIGTWIDNSEFKRTEKYSALHTGYRDSEQLNMPVKYASSNTTTGYYPAKYIQGTFNTDGTLKTDQTSISYYMVRYAEALLNY
ncbi:MAG: RagB/SusD family nutrient uptake outer membrane protein, partial [Parabacteroides sp.]|nr:RagB/SusD family nutrient uptake outer membrane protein [Parabacteroides sp.]